jgi:acyl carrier protein
MHEFKVKLADILEIDEVQDADVLSDFPEWDSLTVLSVISLIHSDYGVSLSSTQIRNVVTVQSLYELVGR